MKLSRKNQRPILALFGTVMLVLSSLLIPLEKQTSAHSQPDEVQNSVFATECNSVFPTECNSVFPTECNSVFPTECDGKLGLKEIDKKRR